METGIALHKYDTLNSLRPVHAKLSWVNLPKQKKAAHHYKTVTATKRAIILPAELKCPFKQ